MSTLDTSAVSLVDAVVASVLEPSAPDSEPAPVSALRHANGGAAGVILADDADEPVADRASARGGLPPVVFATLSLGLGSIAAVLSAMQGTMVIAAGAGLVGIIAGLIVLSRRRGRGEAVALFGATLSFSAVSLALIFGYTSAPIASDSALAGTAAAASVTDDAAAAQPVASPAFGHTVHVGGFDVTVSTPGDFEPTRRATGDDQDAQRVMTVTVTNTGSKTADLDLLFSASANGVAATPILDRRAGIDAGHTGELEAGDSATFLLAYSTDAPDQLKVHVASGFSSATIG
ncbi:hypothetical protein FJ656_24925 [Schumannella luteola]|uniref:DUF4352 domain-containing protein n=1 Tax=Schumannella luteola TaxID=472059 RepID=A0A852YCG5_9MICO|nr:hypothetical protein [Schumannella luteola]NYG98871.1 hypothetical protein [Schumannella luteola]TPX01954.1 hypothetical protein FJ656_24925 [Schumannella luteola]